MNDFCDEYTEIQAGFSNMNKAKTSGCHNSSAEADYVERIQCTSAGQETFCHCSCRYTSTHCQKPRLGEHFCPHI